MIFLFMKFQIFCITTLLWNRGRKENDLSALLKNFSDCHNYFPLGKKKSYTDYIRVNFFFLYKLSREFKLHTININLYFKIHSGECHFGSYSSLYTQHLPHEYRLA